ncbi:M36 family metallopeptidase [Kribbella sp. CA-293567]|uniref:M36 family metallopeptidase n=1 Tax=Kribbella sp. CA-293567 TaxID=3002436 RepID=UPI0022DE582A|nr:M36 family metallopeptidase [Kribbella sp. CA-293567]WBQ02902.1 M36 family metallopeptidase [Kribbella sp. CA-293567]
MREQSRRRKAIAAVTATGAVLALGLSFTSAAGAAPAGNSAANAVPGNLKLIKTKTSLLGKHHWYQQTFKGLPVVGGYYAQHVDKSGKVQVADGRDAVPADLDVSAKVPSATATKSANTVVTARAARNRSAGGKNVTPTPAAAQGAARLAVLGGPNAKLVWNVTSRSSEGASRSLVDAKTGTVVESKVISDNAEGRGSVFDPSPSVTLKNEDLLDNNDKNSNQLFLAQKNVILRNLDGSGYLNGPYVNIKEAKGGVAYNKNNNFVFQRANDKFEQVMAYYQVNQTQEYIHSLGFTEVNNESQDFSINTFDGDNSFYDPSIDMITMGEGGVDDAEDAEVIWHEYGHAIQDDIVPGYGESAEAGAMGEGFGDYWAVTMSIPVSKNYDLPCVMDWDATSYTDGPKHCLRRTDTGKTTDDMVGQVHADGEIWSNALWDIHNALGRNKANKVILQGTFFYAPDTSFADAARVTVQSARLLYGKAAAEQVTNAFKARKIL